MTMAKKGRSKNTAQVHKMGRDTGWFRKVADDLGLDLREVSLSWHPYARRLTVENIVKEKGPTGNGG